jgi:hypothetical protein
MTLAAFLWLKYLDRVLICHPGATAGAAGTDFLGRKANEPVSDLDVLESYSGNVERRVRRTDPS